MNFIVILSLLASWILFSVGGHYLMINDRKRIKIILGIIKKINSRQTFWSGVSLLSKVYEEYNKLRYNEFMTQLKRIPDFPDFFANISANLILTEKIDIKKIVKAILIQDDLNFKKELSEKSLEKRNNIISEIYEKWSMKNYE